MYGNMYKGSYNNKIRMKGKISKLCSKRYHSACSCFFKECIVLGVRCCVLMIALCIYVYIPMVCVLWVGV